MLKITRTNRFKKDYKKIIKHGKDIAKIDSVLMKLASGERLEAKYKNHKLIGIY